MQIRTVLAALLVLALATALTATPAGAANGPLDPTPTCVELPGDGIAPDPDTACGDVDAQDCFVGLYYAYGAATRSVTWELHVHGTTWWGESFDDHHGLTGPAYAHGGIAGHSIPVDFSVALYADGVLVDSQSCVIKV